MLGANHLTNLPSIETQTSALIKPYSTEKTLVQSTAPSTAPTPAWVPWMAGAAIGGIVLYFLVRK